MKGLNGPENDQQVVDISRRQLLTSTAQGLAAAPVLALAGSSALFSESAEAASCVLTPEIPDGPYYIDTQLLRSNIIEDRVGVPLLLKFKIIKSSNCQPIVGAIVDVWHCDALGYYSGYPEYDPDVTHADVGFEHVEPSAPNQHWLRGVQVTNAAGCVTFQSIYPGWYYDRTVHIHLKVYLGDSQVIVTQLYLPDSVTAQVFQTTPPYNVRPTPVYVNATDFGYTSATLLTVTQLGPVRVGALTIGVNI